VQRNAASAARPLSLCCQQVLDQLAKNLEANQAPHCSVQRLDWLRLAELPHAQLGCWPLLLAADVLYASIIVQPFVGALQALLHPEEGKEGRDCGSRWERGRSCLLGSWECCWVGATCLLGTVLGAMPYSAPGTAVER
jgi:hypothetical protein